MRWLAALFLLACAAEPRDAPTDGESLVVRSPVAGTVVLEGVPAPIRARGEVTVGGLGPPPYAVTLETSDERVTLLAMPGPVVDFAAAIEGTTPLRGRPVTLVATYEGVAEPEARVLTADQVIAPSAREAGRLTFEVPEGEPLDVVAIWADEPSIARVALRRADPDEAVPLVREALDRSLAVTVDRDPTARITAELSFAGQPTGLVLGAGAAEPGVATALPRPGTRWSGYGLWVTATARGLGESALGFVGEHLAASAGAHTLRWSAEPDVAPHPTTDASAALPLGRRATTFRWTGAATEATWVEMVLEGETGCGGVRWRVLAPAADGQVLLPVPEGPDPLTMPLIGARFESVRVEGADYVDLFGEGAIPARRLAAHFSRVSRRAIVGWWRGETPGCDGVAQTGRYAVVADGEAECAPGVALAEGLIDRCGRWVSLGGELADDLRCARVEGDSFVFPTGASAPLEAAEGLEGVLQLDVAGGARLLFPQAGAGTSVGAPELAGTWHRVVVDFTDHPDPPSDEQPDGPHVLFSGDGRGGPWMEISPEGDVEIVTEPLSLRGKLAAWDGARGQLRVEPTACPDGAPTLPVSFEEIGGLPALVLTLTEQREAAERRIRLRFSR